MFSFFQNATPKTEDNRYFLHVLRAHERQPINHLPPQPTSILYELMEIYCNNAKESSYYGIPVSLTGWRHHHVQHAKDCMLRLRSKSTTGIQQAICYLNDVTNIDPTGDFASLLSTFFSMYPEFLPECSHELRNVLTLQDFWLTHHIEWMRSIRTTQPNEPPKQYERYAQLAEVLPDTMANEYADELIAALTPHEEPTHSDLYRGWLYSALGKLAHNLSQERHAQVSSLLQSALDSKNLNRGVIGLCAAIRIFFASGQTLNDAANLLFLYLMKNADDLSRIAEVEFNAYVNDWANMHELYVRQLLPTIRAYQHCYSKIQKQSIMHCLIAKNNIFDCRHTIGDMRSWLSPIQLTELEKNLTLLPERHQLIALFWPWLSDSDYRCSIDQEQVALPTSLMTTYRECQQLAESELLGEYRHELPVSHYLQVFIDSNRQHLPENLLTHLQQHLQHMIIDIDNENREDNLESIYAAIPLLARSMAANHVESCKFARIILNTSRMADGAQIAGISAALSLDHNFTPEEHTYIRFTLLSAIANNDYPGYPSPATEALRLYATRTHRSELPAIMTSLLAMPNFEAKMLLHHVRQLYQERKRELSFQHATSALRK